MSLSSSSSSTAGDWLSSSSSTGWANITSSTGGVAPADLFGGAAPNGLVAYGVVCFITVVIFTALMVWYYARPKLPPMVGVLTYLAWLCAFVVCFLVPIDLIPGAGSQLDDVWTTLFWISFLLMWFIIPLASGYYDNGAFTPKQKFKASLRLNLILFAVAGVIGVIGFIYLRAATSMTMDDISGMVIAASNTWGLLILIVMAGYGLVEFPRSLWFNSDLQRRRDEICFAASAIHDEADSTRDELHHTLAFLKLYQERVDETGDETYQEYYREILNEGREKEIELQQMRRRPGPYDKEALEVLEDLKKPDHPVTEKSLMKLNMHVKGTVRHLSLVEAQWRDHVKEFIDLEAAIDTEGRTGARPAVSAYNNICQKLMWYIRIRFLRRILRISAVCSAFMSALIIWMEFFLPFNVNVSPLGAIIKADAVRNNPLALQLFSVGPITYLSVCTYFPLFNMRLSKFYYIGPRRTDENTLLFNATFMLRAATPLAYNFVLLLKMDVSLAHTMKQCFRIGNGFVKATSLVKFIGVIDVIPFFGGSFTKVFPWFIFVIALMTLLNVWGIIGRMLHMERFQYITAGQPNDEAHQEMRDAINEGKKLMLQNIRNEERLREESLQMDGNLNHSASHSMLV